MWYVAANLCQDQLTKGQSDNLQAALEEMLFSCEAPLQELELPSDLIDTVCVQNQNCNEPIEALYYSQPICMYFAKPQDFTDDLQYPKCSDCKGKPIVLKSNFNPIMCTTYTFEFL